MKVFVSGLCEDGAVFSLAGGLKDITLILVI